MSEPESISVHLRHRFTSVKSNKMTIQEQYRYVAADNQHFLARSR